MSKFERHTKKGESYYVYPHKHCQKCGQMIEESLNYCPECYKELKEKREKKKSKKARGTDELENKQDT
jgi:predicted amidophosphoribosyltransferase